MSKLYFLFILTLISIIHFQCASLQEVNTSEITYNRHVRPIIQNYCTTCHSGSDPSGGFTLTTYENVRFNIEDGELLKRINDAKYPMPKGGLMPKKERETIAAWAAGGFKRSNKSTDNEPDYTEQDYEFTPPPIEPIDINQKGIELLDLMQGHWVGSLNIMSEQYEWFAFDYRAIAPSHIHGIYEGGSMGNIFTSFFVTEFKGKRTIFARNGGLLNGIYRTSYFVLETVKISPQSSYFRLVDAYGGKDIMWMELTFTGNELTFNSYTSRFGSIGRPKPHMQFKGKRMHRQLAQAAAQKLNFPQNKIDKDFSKGMPTPDWGSAYPVITSASYIAQEENLDLLSLSRLAKDPYPINLMPYLAQLKVKIKQNPQIQNSKIMAYLSMKSLTDTNGKLQMEYGYLKKELMDGVLSFPEIIPNQKEFTFTYLHPGNYYLTLAADIDKNGYISKEDILSKSTFIEIKPNSKQEISVDQIQFKN